MSAEEETGLTRLDVPDSDSPVSLSPYGERFPAKSRPTDTDVIVDQVKKELLAL